jgi:hypothetical protein
MERPALPKVFPERRWSHWTAVNSCSHRGKERRIQRFPGAPVAERHCVQSGEHVAAAAAKNDQGLVLDQLTPAVGELQQRLVKTGGRLIKLTCYHCLLLAESHRTRRLIGRMVTRTATLPLLTG